MCHNNLMNDCNCKHEQQFMPPTLPKGAGQEDCNCRPSKITLRTKVLPASVGTDAEGQPYAPAVGLFFNSIVSYAANGALYIYDSNGVWTQFMGAGSNNCSELEEQVAALTEANQTLQGENAELTQQNEQLNTELSNILTRLEAI